MAVILEVKHSIPAFGHKSIATSIRQGECEIIKILLSLHTLMQLCFSVCTCYRTFPSCLPSVTLFHNKDSSRPIRVNYCLWHHDQSQKCLVGTPYRTVCDASLVVHITYYYGVTTAYSRNSYYYSPLHLTSEEAHISTLYWSDWLTSHLALRESKLWQDLSRHTVLLSYI